MLVTTGLFTKMPPPRLPAVLELIEVAPLRMVSPLMGFPSMSLT
jgi:hypothetical protein